MSWLWKLLPRRLRPPGDDQAQQAAQEATRKLRQASSDWADVRSARDDLASWLNSAMGRGR